MGMGPSGVEVCSHDGSDNKSTEVAMAKSVGSLVRRSSIFPFCPDSLEVNKVETRLELKINPLRRSSVRARLFAMRYKRVEVGAPMGRLQQVMDDK
jgi:hypothetical protein